MYSNQNAYMSSELLHKLWSALPSNRCEKSFWSALEVLFSPVLGACDNSLRSTEFHTVPHTGRPLAADEIHVLNPDVVRQCNDQRELYTFFSLWNPLGIAAALKAPIETVVEQLLLAVEAKWLHIFFVICCRSCGCDIARLQSVSDIPFSGTYFTSNEFRCPLCTDTTEVRAFGDVSVFFQLDRLHPVFQRDHHRFFCTEEAQKRHLESVFCPAKSGFSFKVVLPKGRFLISGPFMRAFVEIVVDTDGSMLAEKDASLQKIVEMKKIIIGPSRAVAAANRAGQDGKALPGFTNGRTGAINPGSLPRGRIYSRRGSMLSGSNDSGLKESWSCVEGGPEKIPVINCAHGKIHFRVFNETEQSGFIDLSVAFDRRTEFSAIKYPTLFSLTHLFHTAPRGLQTQFLHKWIPRPPSTTTTGGVYVRHSFALQGEDYGDSSIIPVLREVHQYSLEDHRGLLIGVGYGGTSFESSFMSVTAALASSICFFQRVLVRIGARCAMCMRCSITEGPLQLASYQGQYNDTENTRSSYPSVQFVGPVLYASDHPPISPPYLVAMEQKTPELGSAIVRSCRSINHPHSYGGPEVGHEDTTDKASMVRFELRSVLVDEEGYPDLSRGSVGLRDEYIHSYKDSVLRYFLDYLVEHYPGTALVREPHALVLEIPLPIMSASVQTPTILEKSAYTKELTGPF